MLDRLLHRIQRFLRWFFGSPFHAMSDAFGDGVPPEVREFEAQTAEIQHLDRGPADKVQVNHARPKALKGR
jgi:hypothetical protein